LARLRADVHSIDASDVNIQIANAHKRDLVINYRQMLVEDLAKTNEKYDLILALEIIEHIDNIDLFVESCAKLLQGNGLLIFSTINRTISSYLKAIIGAEYILKWLPIGTHEWSKFLKPSEILTYAQKNNLQLYDLQGLSYSLSSKDWYLSEDIQNNYFIVFLKGE
jgi:2-polyprenyl-6-hydroxyphenyl methylase/3-demethylubiquinone-9 3-methyltransferase